MERLAQCHCGSLRATTSGEPLAAGTVRPVSVGLAQSPAALHPSRRLRSRSIATQRSSIELQSPTEGSLLFQPQLWNISVLEPDARPDQYILAVGMCLLVRTSPAQLVSIYVESKHTWMQLPDGMKHFQGAIISGG
jgi:hypothetical protein